MSNKIFDQLTTAMERAGLYRGLEAPILLRGKAFVPEEWYDPQHTAYIEGLAAGLNLDMQYNQDAGRYEFTAKGEVMSDMTTTGVITEVENREREDGTPYTHIVIEAEGHGVGMISLGGVDLHHGMEREIPPNIVKRLVAILASRTYTDRTPTVSHSKVVAWIPHNFDDRKYRGQAEGWLQGLAEAFGLDLTFEYDEVKNTRCEFTAPMPKKE